MRVTLIHPCIGRHRGDRRRRTDGLSFGIAEEAELAAADSKLQQIECPADFCKRNSQRYTDPFGLGAGEFSRRGLFPNCSGDPRIRTQTRLMLGGIAPRILVCHGLP